MPVTALFNYFILGNSDQLNNVGDFVKIILLFSLFEPFVTIVLQDYILFSKENNSLSEIFYFSIVLGILFFLFSTSIFLLNFENMSLPNKIVVVFYFSRLLLKSFSNPIFSILKRGKRLRCLNISVFLQALAFFGSSLYLILIDEISFLILIPAIAADFVGLFIAVFILLTRYSYQFGSIKILPFSELKIISIRSFSIYINKFSKRLDEYILSLMLASDLLSIYHIIKKFSVDIFSLILNLLYQVYTIEFSSTKKLADKVNLLHKYKEVLPAFILFLFAPVAFFSDTIFDHFFSSSISEYSYIYVFLLFSFVNKVSISGFVPYFLYINIDKQVLRFTIINFMFQTFIYCLVLFFYPSLYALVLTSSLISIALIFGVFFYYGRFVQVDTLGTLGAHLNCILKLYRGHAVPFFSIMVLSSAFFTYFDVDHAYLSFLLMILYYFIFLLINNNFKTYFFNVITKKGGLV